MTTQEFVEQIKKILLDQGNHSKSGHPDPSIRNFNDAFKHLIETNSQVQNFVISVHLNRNHLNPDHFVFLISRAAQFILRQNNQSNYTNFQVSDWEQQILNFVNSDQYYNLLITKHNTSTQPRVRYRSLAALLGLIKKDVNIIDLGCSLNLGLTCLLESNIDCNAMEDFTPDSLVCNTLSSDYSQYIKCATGIDIIDPYADINWTKACEYMTNYVQHSNDLDQDIASRNKLFESKKLFTIQTDITQTNIGTQLKEKISKNNLNIVNASMFLYQLNEIEKNNLLSQLSILLNEGDILMELAPHNLDSWFSKNNITTTIKFIKDQTLTNSFEWLVWDSPRCKKVWQGHDFDAIKEYFLNQKVPITRPLYYS